LLYAAFCDSILDCLCLFSVCDVLEHVCNVVFGWLGFGFGVYLVHLLRFYQACTLIVRYCYVTGGGRIIE